jgi:hypothetical protein
MNLEPVFYYLGGAAALKSFELIFGLKLGNSSQIFHSITLGSLSSFDKRGFGLTGRSKAS